MPIIGEIRTAQELGLVGGNKRIWLPCKSCGTLRWTKYCENKPSKDYCNSCSQKIGGKQKLPRGEYPYKPKLVSICRLCGIEFPTTIQYFPKNKSTKSGLCLSKCKKCLNKTGYEREISTIKGRINRRISAYIYQTLKGTKNYNHWESLVGYTVERLIKHLEKRFAKDMSWDNYGKWHIDHVIPQSAFHFTFPDDIDFKRCWALSNLQPLWAAENIAKSDRITKPFQPSLKIK